MVISRVLALAMVIATVAIAAPDSAHAASTPAADTFQRPLTSWAPHCLGFGTEWRYCNGVALRACPNGAVWLHTGVDIKAVAGQPVMAAADGVIAGYTIDPQFHGGVLIRHRTSFGIVLTQYWHVWIASGFTVGTHVSRGQVFAYIASMGDKTHFHFAVFRGDLETTAWRGALPPTACAPGFPAFPYRFVDPNAFLAGHPPAPPRIGQQASQAEMLRRQIQPILAWLLSLI